MAIMAITGALSYLSRFLGLRIAKWQCGEADGRNGELGALLRQVRRVGDHLEGGVKLLLDVVLT